ncbi:hypothetical protein U6G28_08820 [Actinomycetaceae bacterium MB13-C1-2]|nr:hypothetical protein U6G28_08820 [Actinomycetaceae bacterium MB13-C1-2]
MSETTETKTPVPTPPTQSEQTWTPPASQEALDKIIGERVNRERSKYADYEDLKKKAAEFDAIEEAQKTEAQKQADEIAALKAQVAANEAEKWVAAWKTEVETATGVPAKALAGSTLEEIQAHAETLKALGVGKAATPTPQVVPTIGQEPTIPGNVSIDAQIAAATKAGDMDLVGTLKAIKLGGTKTA